MDAAPPPALSNDALHLDCRGTGVTVTAKLTSAFLILSQFLYARAAVLVKIDWLTSSDVRMKLGKIECGTMMTTEIQGLYPSQLSQ